MPAKKKKTRRAASFASFFRSRLLPELERFERTRRRRFPVLVLLLALAFAGPAYLLARHSPAFGRLIPYLAGLTLLIVVGSFAVAYIIPSSLYRGTKIRANSSYLVALLIVPIKAMETAARAIGGVDQFLFHNASRRLDFSRAVVDPTVAFAMPGLTRRSVEYVGQGDFLESRLYGFNISRYTGRDYFYGAWRGVDFAFSWLKAEFIPKDKDNRPARILFRGWFFSLGFGKHFAGETLLHPDVAEATMGWLGRSMQGLFVPAGMHLLRLENAEFEHYFKVYSTGRNEGRYILSPSLMQTLASFRKRLGGPLALSFRGDRLYAAIPAPAEYFSLFPARPFTDPTFTRHLYHAVRGMAEVADDIKRNQRLWRETLDKL